MRKNLHNISPTALFSFTLCRTTTTTTMPALPFALLLSLYVCLCVTEDMFEVRSESGADVSLLCTAHYKPSVQYRAVRWYKVREPQSSRLSGLLTRDLPDGPMRWYSGLERDVALLNESLDLLLFNATCGDGGVYTCHLAAPVGEQNQEGRVRLTVTDCPESAAENPMTDAFMVILATAVLIFALVTFIISYVCLKNSLRDKNKMTKKEILLDAPLKPLEKKDLMLIYTLGPKSKTSSIKHICV